MIVGVKQVAAVIGMAGEMELRYPIGRNGVDVAERVEAMV